MNNQINELGYTQDYFPFNTEELNELKVIAQDAAALTPDERKSIFKHFPRVRELFQNAIDESEFNLELTEYCFFIEKNSSNRNWPLLFHKDINLPKYMNIPAENNEAYLKKAIMFRLTLDTSDKDTGALKVIPKSHIGEDMPEVFVDTLEGEVIWFRPLLLHASNKMKRPHQRRVFQVLCIEK